MANDIRTSGLNVEVLYAPRPGEIQTAGISLEVLYCPAASGPTLSQIMRHGQWLAAGVKGGTYASR